MRQLKRVITLLLCALLVGGTPLSAFAESSSSIKSKIASAKEKRDAIAAEVSAIGSKLQDTEYQLQQTQAQLTQVQSDLDVQQQQLKVKQDHLAQVMVDDYKSGPLSLLEVIVNSRGFDQLIANIYYVGKIAATDRAAIADVQNSKAQLETSKMQLEVLKSSQTKLYNSQQAESSQLKAQQQKQQDYINSLDADLKKALAEEDAASKKKAQEAAEKARKEAERNIPGGGSTGSVSGDRAKLVQIAYSLIGVPYVLGGSSPSSGLDCSGFTSYCYAAIGHPIPHSSVGQASCATAKSLSALEPGDLIFWIGTAGGSATGSHVGMYIGNGQMIHANGHMVCQSGITPGYTKCGSIL